MDLTDNSNIVRKKFKGQLNSATWNLWWEGFGGSHSSPPPLENKEEEKIAIKFCFPRIPNHDYSFFSLSKTKTEHKFSTN